MLCFHAVQTGKHLLRPRKSETPFVSATNAARAGKRGNVCVGSNVSSFARALRREGAVLGNPQIMPSER